jgi:hypothetical protein
MVSTTAAAGCLGLIAMLANPLAGSARQELFPSQDTFRSLQLAAQDCGRENNAETCDRARELAEPLMDHTRLPATCKDTIWEILQKATVAPTNDFQRRDGINRAAEDLMVFCRQRSQPAPAQPNAPSSGGIPGLNPTRN